ncbi:hypothetical protein DQ04_08161000 [Trypanosoma grayi]|uniref:hypothetical protein n=1 Tax=Trypanosoma grayi TaxID=71804 RepID=UPI0004F4036E|nr:hypothetical protein DQ04_08161000 [Trypanosoma grayi]KEG08037.1 hypothetical protein DQ04_08161000 [Trypanosoma grayi]
MGAGAWKVLESLPGASGAAGCPGRGRFAAGRALHAILPCQAPRAPPAREGSGKTGSSALKGLSKRVYSYCGAVAQPICHGAGARGEPHSKGHVGPFGLGAKGVHNAKTLRLRGKVQSRGSWGKRSPFIVSLQLGKSSAAQYTRTLLTLLASGRSPAQMILSGLQRKAAADPIKQARPMERWNWISSEIC